MQNTEPSDPIFPKLPIESETGRREEGVRDSDPGIWYLFISFILVPSHHNVFLLYFAFIIRIGPEFHRNDSAFRKHKIGSHAAWDFYFPQKAVMQKKKLLLHRTSKIGPSLPLKSIARKKKDNSTIICFPDSYLTTYTALPCQACVWDRQSNARIAMDGKFEEPKNAWVIGAFDNTDLLAIVRQCLLRQT